MVGDLNVRLREESEVNSKLKYDINQLTNNFNRERNKLEEMDQILSEELKQGRIKEQETVKDFEEMEIKNQTLIQDIKREEQKQTEL